MDHNSKYLQINFETFSKIPYRKIKLNQYHTSSFKHFWVHLLWVSGKTTSKHKNDNFHRWTDILQSHLSSAFLGLCMCMESVMLPKLLMDLILVFLFYLKESYFVSLFLQVISCFETHRCSVILPRTTLYFLTPVTLFSPGHTPPMEQCLVGKLNWKCITHEKNWTID